jgi:hypothetical protein
MLAFEAQNHVAVLDHHGSIGIQAAVLVSIVNTRWKAKTLRRPQTMVVGFQVWLTVILVVLGGADSWCVPSRIRKRNKPNHGSDGEERDRGQARAVDEAGASLDVLPRLYDRGQVLLAM